MIVNKQIRTKNLGLKEFLARKRKQNVENTERTAERLHSVSEERDKEIRGTSGSILIQEIAERKEKEKELVDEAGTVATEEEVGSEQSRS